ncbi:MAG: FIST N-terminal domain-containing protein [Mariprofundaceae bacterium]
MKNKMQVYSGKSAQADMDKAIVEATEHWPKKTNIQHGIIFCFYPKEEQAIDLSEGLARKFPGIVIAGCSTAGEWLDGHHYDGNVVMMAIFSEHIRWSAIAIEALDQLDDDRMKSSFHELLESRGDKRHLDYQVCITMIDGLSLQEEKFSAMLGKYLQGIPMLGGSSGDGLRFEKTSLLIQTPKQRCRRISQAAIVLLVESDKKLHAIKHQHFGMMDNELIITSATPDRRLVHTFNGMNAAECYAQSVGCHSLDLSPDTFSDFPLIYHYRGELYVRSIQKVETDGSLTFYCAIEEGVILNLGKRKNMKKIFLGELSNLSNPTGEPKIALVFNCILRALESKHLDCCQDLTRQLQSYIPHTIGFDTYGEQWNGIHVNQTFTALILYDDKGEHDD